MEKRVKTVLEERIKKKHLDQHFGRIIIPTVTSEVFDEKGKKKKVESKMMPGYIFVEMEMIGTAYDLVKSTPKVGSFLGAAQGKEPPPLSEAEIDRIINRAAIVAKEEAAKPKAVFEKGEKVKVIDGPFTNFVGDVDEIKTEKQKLRLLISVFGRPTPVEIEFSKVERIDPNAQPEA
jgi:transcriptional antiterminator NusG